jgi:hypothetical protein
MARLARVIRRAINYYPYNIPMEIQGVAKKKQIGENSIKRNKVT